MVTFELNPNAALTGSERQQLAKAKKLPIVYDEDSPELTDEMEAALIAARKEKPYRGIPLTVYVSRTTMNKIINMGTDHTAILGKLLEQAVDEYSTIYQQNT